MEPTKTIPAPIQWSEQGVFEALRTYYVETATALLPQVASSTGANVRRYADAISMQLWPSRGLTIDGIEIKTDRRDWLRELEHPEKADVISTYCHYWYVATPPGIVKDGELPSSWGHLEVSVTEPGVLGMNPETDRYDLWLKPHTYKVRVAKKAVENTEVREPTRGFLASILRNLQAHESPEAVANRLLTQEKHKYHLQAWETAEKEIEKARSEVAEYRRRIARFEQATGLETGVFKSVWREEDLDKTHAESKRKLQMAHSLDHWLEKARSVAGGLEGRAKDLTDAAAGLRGLLDMEDE